MYLEGVPSCSSWRRCTWSCWYVPPSWCPCPCRYTRTLSGLASRETRRTLWACMSQLGKVFYCTGHNFQSTTYATCSVFVPLHILKYDRLPLFSDWGLSHHVIMLCQNLINLDFLAGEIQRRRVILLPWAYSNRWPKIVASTILAKLAQHSTSDNFYNWHMDVNLIKDRCMSSLKETVNAGWQTCGWDDLAAQKWFSPSQRRLFYTLQW